MEKPVLIIGDVHGCRLELLDLLEVAGYEPNMRLVFVGDLINKGPDSAGVLELVRELGAEVVLGNHELGFMKYVAQGGVGKADFDEVVRQMGNSLSYWTKWMAGLPLFIEDKRWCVVHAGFEPGRDPGQSTARILTKIRTWDGVGKDLNNPKDPPWHDFYTKKKLVVYGHWAEAGLTVRENTIGLDSGCVYGNYLSGLILPERRIIQVPAKAVYRKPESVNRKRV